MVETKRLSGFNENACTRCGICLHKCPVLEYPIEKSKTEIKRLIEGKETSEVLFKCNTCFSCNIYCPEDANPYQLILGRWNDLYYIRGAPSLYTFVCPTREPNIWQLLNIFLSTTEKRWILRWISNYPDPSKPILLIGNYTHLFPFIIGGSKLLEYFSPVDLIDHWEGGAYLYQGGFLDVVQKIAQKTKKDFDRWDNKKIVATLDAVQYIYQEVHPKEMRVKHKQQFESFQDWMLHMMNSGKLAINNKLDLTVTVHDNCYSKVSNGKYWEAPREIVKKCGCRIIEMEHNKQDSLCCGFGAGASWVRNISIPFDIIYEGIKKFEEAENTGAQALISYCGGCIYLLWATRELLGSKIDIFHIIEIVRMAIGEELNYPNDHIERAWDIIAIITYEWIISLFKPNFYIKKVSYDEEKSTFKPSDHTFLKLIRVAFSSALIRKLYRKFFLLMMRVLNTR
ncbi:MAG: 4Fe-4S dicluster domain-containing protein [Candidatus Lokiarchaeota archaeon]|nr:4Fe-4S dicluster domain-containing protein [Candidatus Lokiarchaeota archaeon]